MTHEEAMQCALGYAWGAEDHGGKETAAPTEAPGSLTFAEAYAAGWDDMNAERRCQMPNAGSAYARWQATGGATIFPPPPRLGPEPPFPGIAAGANLDDVAALLAGARNYAAGGSEVAHRRAMALALTAIGELMLAREKKS